MEKCRLEGVACENPVGFCMYERPMETAEYICVNVGISLAGSCHKTAEDLSLSPYSRSIGDEYKKMRCCFISLKRGSEADWMEPYHTVKVCVILHKWEILHVLKGTTIKKWGLNTCRNFVNLRKKDFFVD